MRREARHVCGAASIGLWLVVAAAAFQASTADSTEQAAYIMWLVAFPVALLAVALAFLAVDG